jgi:hypothetical protein
MSVDIAQKHRFSVFDFKPGEFSAQYAKDGYVRIPGGVNPEFLRFVQETTRQQLDQDKSLKDWNFKGKKRQYLFDFPDSCDFPHGVKEMVAQVTGLDVTKLTLCERHIKVYDSEADPNPPPHKDRLASEVAVGIPVTVPKDSMMVVYPRQLAGINPYHTTAALRASLDEEDLPEHTLANEKPVEIDLQLGDVVMFRGSALYHERLHAANTIMLYLKFNSLRLDPLGEDPSTMLQFANSQKTLEALDDDALLDSVIEVSPRLECVNRIYSRLHWKELLHARVSGEKEFTISEDELQMLRNTDGARTVREVVETVGYSVGSYGAILPRIRRLVRLGGVDIVER